MLIRSRPIVEQIWVAIDNNNIPRNIINKSTNWLEHAVQHEFEPPHAVQWMSAIQSWLIAIELLSYTTGIAVYLFIYKPMRVQVQKLFAPVFVVVAV